MVAIDIETALLLLIGPKLTRLQPKCLLQVDGADRPNDPSNVLGARGVERIAMGEAVGTATSKANAALTADGHSEKDSSRTGSEPSRHDQHACAFRTAAEVFHRRAEPQLGQPSLAAKCTVLGFTTVAHSAVPAKLCISARNGSGPCNLVWHQGRNSATRPCLLHGPSSISVSAGPLPVPLSGPGTSIEVQTRTVGLPSAAELGLPRPAVSSSSRGWPRAVAPAGRRLRQWAQEPEPGKLQPR